MKLYEIDQNIRTLWDKISQQAGELTAEDIEELESLAIAKDEKIKGYGVIIKETTANIGVVKAEIERLNKLVKSMQSKAEWLTNRLETFMKEHELKEFNSIETNITFRTSKQLQIEDESKLAKKWLKVETKPDKQAIKDFINAGGKVKGCQIVEKQNIQIK